MNDNVSDDAGVAMETIFDHEPTAEELRYLTGPQSAEQYRQVTTEDQALAGLSMLFAMRGDSKRADAYARRIQDEDLRFEFCYNDLISESNASKTASSSTDSAFKAA